MRLDHFLALEVAMRRTREEWRELVRRQERSGLSVAEFCRREKAAEPSFYRWRRIFSDELEASFVPLAVVEQRAVEQSAVERQPVEQKPVEQRAIEIELSCGATVRVAADRETLREVFAALRSVGVNDA